MADPPSLHDHHPVGRWQVLHLVGGQHASALPEQAADAGLEDVRAHMGIHSAQGVVQQGNV